MRCSIGERCSESCFLSVAWQRCSPHVNTARHTPRKRNPRAKTVGAEEAEEAEEGEEGEEGEEATDRAYS